VLSYVSNQIWQKFFIILGGLILVVPLMFLIRCMDFLSPKPQAQLKDLCLWESSQSFSLSHRNLSFNFRYWTSFISFQTLYIPVPTRPRALTKVNTWWDPSRAQGDKKGGGQASGVDRPRALTSLGH